MTVEQWTAFLGWNTAIQVGLLIVTALLLMVMRRWVMRIHAAVSGVEVERLPMEYFRFLALWKVLIIVFLLVPYFVMRCLV